MKLSCARGAEIRELLDRGHWPGASSSELSAHAASCRRCGDLVLLHGAFQGARAVSAGQASLPPAGVLWWRAQIRQRNANLATINRPIAGAQIFALVVLMATAVTLSLALFPQAAREGSNWVAAVKQSPAFHLESLWAGANLARLTPVWPGSVWLGSVWLATGLVMLALMFGLAAYLVAEKQ